MHLRPKGAQDYGIENQRHDNLISIFGKDLLSKLKNLKIAIIGSGANGYEILRNLALLGASTDKGNIFIVDDAKLKKFNLNIHFWMK